MTSRCRKSERKICKCTVSDLVRTCKRNASSVDATDAVSSSTSHWVRPMRGVLTLLLVIWTGTWTSNICDYLSKGQEAIFAIGGMASHANADAARCAFAAARRNSAAAVFSSAVADLRSRVWLCVYLPVWKGFWNGIKSPALWARPQKSTMRWRAFRLRTYTFLCAPIRIIHTYTQGIWVLF